ncbi:MAG: sulfite exporter TauE/SafE family protein [Nitrospinae bacterium]|nr:sulfite exporter TauE/SafE family protein [Nitrospinota bacterium]
MNESILFLTFTAASIGFIHTLLGPDHYLPFIAMAKARSWNLPKTLWITFLCGIGHIGSSIIIGLVGVALGLGITGVTDFESVRGEIAAWGLIVFGLLYALWGLKSAIKNKPHTHHHTHHDGTTHEHTHTHHEEHLHPHEASKKEITTWALFVIFFLGPCEPLIPLLIYPAAQETVYGVFLVIAVFSVATLVAMMGMVFLSLRSISFINIKPVERFSHVIAGCVIVTSGLMIQFAGL